MQDVTIDSNTTHMWNTEYSIDSSASYYDEDFHEQTDNSKVLKCLLVDYSFCTGLPSLRNGILSSIYDRLLLKRARPCSFENKMTTKSVIKHRQPATKQIRAKIDIDRVIQKCCYSIDEEFEKLRKANMDIPEIMRVCRSNAIPPSDASVTSLETFLPEMITDVPTIPPSDVSAVASFKLRSLEMITDVPTIPHSDGDSEVSFETCSPEMITAAPTMPHSDGNSVVSFETRSLEMITAVPTMPHSDGNSVVCVR